MIVVNLRTRRDAGDKPPRNLYLREISGDDELAELSASSLINRLLLDVPGAAVSPGRAAALTLSEQDFVINTIYRSLYGEKVECHLQCASCDQAFAVSFSLDELSASVEEVTPADADLLRELQGPDVDGVYGLGQLRFRLPTGEDLAAVSGLDPDAMSGALRNRCVLAGGDEESDDRLERAMALAGPLLDTNMAALCAACGREQPVPFRMGDFLLAALGRERALLTREVHELARAYRWSRHEILALPRGLRREHVSMVLAEMEAEGAWA